MRSRIKSGIVEGADRRARRVAAPFTAYAPLSSAIASAASLKAWLATGTPQ